MPDCFGKMLWKWHISILLISHDHTLRQGRLGNVALAGVHELVYMSPVIAITMEEGEHGYGYSGGTTGILSLLKLLDT